MMRALTAHLATFLRDESGTPASEFVLVLPFFVVVMFGTINGALAMSAVNQIHYAAERSARCLAVNVTLSCTKANIDSWAKNWYRGPGLTSLAFTSPTTDPACGRQVIGTGAFSIITGIDATAVTLTATACYPII